MRSDGSESTQDAPPDPCIRKQELYPHEQYWAEYYDLLKSAGYMLRPRYRPGNPLTSEEDRITVTRINVMDATQLSGGAKVFLKRMPISEVVYTRELGIMKKNAPGNRSVPVLEFLFLPGEEGLEYRIAVMPYFRVFDDPQFQTLGEILEAVSQFLEGLEFIHSLGIAHRDACWLNMMMDASQLVPGGWHFSRPWTEDGWNQIKFVPRSTVKMQYYFIDFELSKFVVKASPQASGIVGQDKTVPEFQSGDQTRVYDPYKLDIFQLGNAFKNRIIQNYEGVECLDPLVESMTSEIPSDRPSTSEARKVLEPIIKAAKPTRSVKLRPGVLIMGSEPLSGRPGQLSLLIGSTTRWVSRRASSLRNRFL